MNFAIRNARLVLRDDVVTGTMHVLDGVIQNIDSRANGAGDDWEGDYLIPGLVELHTDNAERHLLPRPGVDWPRTQAIVAHDAEVAASGITTVFDALRVGEWENEGSIAGYAAEMIGALETVSKAGLFRADHLLHLRCEIGCDNTADEFATFADHSLLRLVSIMDHTPGQRQFTNLDKFVQYYSGKYNLNGDALDRFMEERRAAQVRNSNRHRKAIVAICQQKGVALASHDDATVDHVAEASEDGMVIAEFPTTVEAADKSCEHGMAVMMGAPNVVRGGSHSGNIAAQSLAEGGMLDILSSDYVPASLLHAAFMLAQRVEPISLPDAIATVTANPADAVGLVDRGEIAAGKRADFIRVKIVNDAPIVRSVWREGTRVV